MSNSNDNKYTTLEFDEEEIHYVEIYSNFELKRTFSFLNSEDSFFTIRIINDYLFIFHRHDNIVECVICNMENDEDDLFSTELNDGFVPCSNSFLYFLSDDPKVEFIDDILVFNNRNGERKDVIDDDIFLFTKEQEILEQVYNSISNENNQEDDSDVDSFVEYEDDDDGEKKHFVRSDSEDSDDCDNCEECDKESSII